MTRRTRKSLILLSLLVLAGFAVWKFFPFQSVAERMVVSYFARHGVAVDYVTVDSYTDSELVLRDLKIGEDIELSNLVLRYRLKDLLEGRILSAGLDALSVTLTQKNGTWQVSALAPLLEAGKSTVPAAPLFDRLPAETSRIKRLSLALKPENGPPLSFKLDNPSLAPQSDGTYRLTVDAITQLATPPVIAPLTANLLLANTGETLTLTGTINSINGILNADVNATLTPQGAPTSIALSPRAVFTDAAQPAAIFPALKAKLPEFRGSVSTNIHLYGTEGTRPSAVITLNDLSIITDSARAEGIRGRVELNSLSPPLTDGVQKISIRKLTAGLPLEKGELSFKLLPNDTLLLLPTRWQWSGGILSTEEQRFDLAHFTLDHLTLGVENLPLAALLSMALKEGLSADGTVSGRLPVRLKDGKIFIENGSMKSSENGSIRYFPGTASPLQKGQNAHTDLLLQALENFHFSLMELTLTNESPSVMKLGLTIKGNNPDLYGGKPIDLNINLTGDLFGLVESGLKAYQIPETLEKQINEKRN